MRRDQGEVDPARLGELMELRRVELGLTWEAVARRAGISRTTLNEIRKGKIENTQPLTKRAIERALDWASGSVDSILVGDEPTPVVAAVGGDEPEAAAVAREPRHGRGAAGDVTPEDIMLTLQKALDRGREWGREDLLFWQTLHVVNDLHNPLRESLREMPVEPVETDRSA